MKKSVVVLLLFTFLFAGCASTVQVTGFLEGKVTIGPIYPVEKPGPPPPTPPEVYQARKIMVYDENRTKLIKQVDIDGNGNYRVELAAGVYIVDINRIGIDHSGQVPRKVDIKTGQTVKLDVDIDTGIR